MELKIAQNLAVDMCYKLQPYCEKINIAGSVRRKKPEVKDIEIICIAKKEVQKDMFGYPTTSLPLPAFTNTVRSFGNVIKGNTAGRYMQIKLLPEEINLDLFMPEPMDYFRQLCIRTGPAEYSQKVIAAAWLKKGFCGSNKGLRKISDCIEQTQPDGSKKWLCINAHGELPPRWESEAAFYDWLRIPYLEPTKRVA